MRPAAQGWEEDFAANLESTDFVCGNLAPTLCYRGSTGCRCVVHGHDFTFTSEHKLLQDNAQRMKETSELKVCGVVGDEPGDDEEIAVDKGWDRVKGDLE